jgi:hypothetical protein
MKLPDDCNSNEFSVVKKFYYKQIDLEVDNNTKQKQIDLKVDNNTKQKHIDLFNEIIRNMVGNDEEVLTALVKNFARVVQKPLERPDICIVLSSKEHGVGKESIIKIIANVIGRKNVARYIKDDDFWDKHDTKKEGAIIIHLEEAGMTNIKMADALKSRISSDIMSIRPCGISAYDVDNVALYIFTTNKPLPVKLEGDEDRRFFIILCKGRQFNNKEEKIKYWENVYSVINTDEFIKTIGEYLETIDLDDFNPRNFPITEYLKSLMEVSKSSEVMFLSQWIHDGDGDDANTFYSKYKQYCVENILPYKQNIISFTKHILREDSYYIKHKDSETRRVFYTKKN